jgi:hypothetical protein
MLTERRPFAATRTSKMEATNTTRSQRLMRLDTKQPRVRRTIRALFLIATLIALAGCARRSAPVATGTVAIGASGAGGTATADQLQRLKSWGLSPADLPSGMQLTAAQSLRESLAAAGDQTTQQQLSARGVADGYVQQWLQNTTQVRIKDEFDLFTTSSSAKAILGQPVTSNATYEITNLPNPKLGDVSRMYRFVTAAQATPRLQGWVVQWVRGRTLFEVNEVDPTGQLQDTSILNAARTIDNRAAKDTIK